MSTSLLFYFFGMLALLTNAYTVRGRPTFKPQREHISARSFHEHNLKASNAMKAMNATKAINAMEANVLLNATLLKQTAKLLLVLNRKLLLKAFTYNLCFSSSFYQGVAEVKPVLVVNHMCDYWSVHVNYKLTSLNIFLGMVCFAIILALSYFRIHYRVFLFTNRLLLNYCLVFSHIELLCTILLHVLFGVLDEDCDATDVYINCNVLEKAEQLCVINYNAEFISINDIRSRKGKFLYSKQHKLNIHQAAHVRDREPSRVPAKRINKILHKSRKLRRLLCSYILRYVPKSSKIHNLVYRVRRSNVHRDCSGFWKYCKSNLFSYQRSLLRCYRYIKKLCNNFFPITLIKNCNQGYFYDTTNQNILIEDYIRDICCHNVFKSLNHKKSYYQFTLSRDIESNPGPFTQNTTMPIIPSMTITVRSVM